MTLAECTKAAHRMWRIDLIMQNERHKNSRGLEWQCSAYNPERAKETVNDVDR